MKVRLLDTKRVLGYMQINNFQKVSSCPKGQLILECPFDVFKSPKKTNKIFSRISALVSKKRSNQKNRDNLLYLLVGI